MANNTENVWVRSNLPIKDYKSAYEAVRRIMCDAEAFDPTKEETIEKCMWISAMAEIMGNVPMNAVRVVSADNSLLDSTTLIRREFPRKRSWNKLFGERDMDILLYAMVYEGLLSISRDTDDFDIYGVISDVEVKKCELVSAIHEVTNDILQKYVNPILADVDMKYDWFDFYDNYYFE